VNKLQINTPKDQLLLCQRSNFNDWAKKRLLISSNWRWYLLQRIVYCSHVSLHFLPT